MTNTRAHIDQYLSILNDNKINFSITAPFIQILKGTDYRISIANVAYPARIDAVGFFLPALPAVKYIPENMRHGRVLCQIDMSAPKDYILDLFRVIVLSMRKLPIPHAEWTRKNAPIIVLDGKLQTMMEKIYENSKDAQESERIASISVRPKKNDPAAEFLSPMPIAEHHIITRHEHDTDPEIVLPILDFDNLVMDQDNELILDWLDSSNMKTPVGTNQDLGNLLIAPKQMPESKSEPLSLTEAHKTVSARRSKEK